MGRCKLNNRIVIKQSLDHGIFDRCDVGIRMDTTAFGTGRDGVIGKTFITGTNFGTAIKACQRIQVVTVLEHKPSRIQSVKDTLDFLEANSKVET
jgi:hypothetical protein